MAFKIKRRRTSPVVAKNSQRQAPTAPTRHIDTPYFDHTDVLVVNVDAEPDLSVGTISTARALTGVEAKRMGYADEGARPVSWVFVPLVVSANDLLIVDAFGAPEDADEGTWDVVAELRERMSSFAKSALKRTVPPEAFGIASIVVKKSNAAVRTPKNPAFATVRRNKLFEAADQVRAAMEAHRAAHPLPEDVRQALADAARSALDPFNDDILYALPDWARSGS